jgi:hypothetical protein
MSIASSKKYPQLGCSRLYSDEIVCTRMSFLHASLHVNKVTDGVDHDRQSYEQLLLEQG